MRPAGSDPAPVAGRLGIDRRTIQIALGVLWILDAALQFQPTMFTQGFVHHVILPNATGQPSWLAAAVTHMANFVSHEVAMWNALFALIQLGIGVGLLFRRSVRPALIVSFVWAFSIWVIGEGMGQIFTGTATVLMGAPGAVALYALIGALVWPTPERDPQERRTGIASSAAGHGPLGGRGALIVWTALWTFYAVLFVLPDNRTANGLHDMVMGMSRGEPGWYGHFLNAIGNAFTGAGTSTSVILAILCLLIAVGPLVRRDPAPFLYGGAALALVFWVTGQGLGGILTGSGTDPNAGPLLVLLAVATLPTVLAPAGSLTPAARLAERRPGWLMAGLAGLIVLPVSVAAIPLASSAAPASSGKSGSAATVASSSAGSSSMPGMSMAGMSMPGMSHKGSASADMAGMGGTGATDPSWQYQGPPLPQAETKLLTYSSDTQDQGHAMQTPNCTKAPTSQQLLGATEYVQAVTTAVAKYKVLSAATSAGYIPVTPTGYPVVHYVNPAYMQSKYIMDPNHVDSLVYAFTPNGPVLVAAMFLLPSNKMQGPMPYGCLVQWHAHTNLCSSDVTHTIVGFTPCGPGTYNEPTAYMTHVWQVPVPGGPLAIDPSDLQVVEAAINGQLNGTAPTTSPDGTVTYTDSTSPVGAF